MPSAPSQKRKLRGYGIILAAMLCAGAVGYGGSDLSRDVTTANVRTSELTKSASVHTATMIGRASVIDGDTIDIRGERIRFNGIDAPESSQLCKNGVGQDYRCGAKSAEALHGFLAASFPTRCEFVERDQYDRFVGDCFRADNASVQEWLVRNGHAMDWPRYSHGAYSSAQAVAQAERLGIWRGSFEKPWQWRASQRAVAVAPTAPLMTPSSEGGGCRIKGNISDKGERIYHVPGQHHYGKTRIATGKGERWFCSEAEARQAGWRRSQR